MITDYTEKTCEQCVYMALCDSASTASEMMQLPPCDGPNMELTSFKQKPDGCCDSVRRMRAEYSEFGDFNYCYYCGTFIGEVQESALEQGIDRTIESMKRHPANCEHSRQTAPHFFECNNCSISPFNTGFTFHTSDEAHTGCGLCTNFTPIADEPDSCETDNNLYPYRNHFIVNENSKPIAFTNAMNPTVWDRSEATCTRCGRTTTDYRRNYVTVWATVRAVLCSHCRGVIPEAGPDMIARIQNGGF